MKRRDFLMNTLVAGALYPLPSSARSAAPEARMTLGYGTYGLRSLPTEKAIDRIAKMGFDSVEFTIWPDWDLDPVQVDARRRK